MTMKLKNLIKQLQQQLDKEPKLGEYVVKFREEVGSSENITHHHTEGRILILSGVWATDQLNPVAGSERTKDSAKVRDKIVAFKTDAEMALEDAIAPK